MPLLNLYRLARSRTRNVRSALHANNDKLGHRLLDVFLRTWDLGFVGFGGPPVHFQIIHRRFVEGGEGKPTWIDEQTVRSKFSAILFAFSTIEQSSYSQSTYNRQYQELFAICQALPGPGSTKMLFCVILIHAGFIPAILVFLTWSLPGAIGMYALSLGISRVNDVLPSPVYALLSGLNASTVGK